MLRGKEDGSREPWTGPCTGRVWKDMTVENVLLQQRVVESTKISFYVDTLAVRIFWNRNNNFIPGMKKWLSKTFSKCESFVTWLRRQILRKIPFAIKLAGTSLIVVLPQASVGFKPKQKPDRVGFRLQKILLRSLGLSPVVNKGLFFFAMCS